ncbi:MAG TPA: mannitol dehydrogenase family protein [Solirubrobacterales bacterium]|nr:mannitol dehydrogenase family protein [Solirubrobacterales bacterium]
MRENDGSRAFPRVRVPSYDRTALRPGIVHIGVGGFHRSHQAVYLDRLAASGISNAWGILGVGVRNGGSRGEMLRQNCLYTLLERSPEDDRARVVGSILDYLHAPREPGRALAALTSEQTKVVSLTVTGDGYGEEAPVPRFLAEALRLRREAGVAPFTVLSCDNLPDNGATARSAVVAYARLRDEERFADWIETEVSFPSTVVDRITPVTEPEHHDLLERDFGIHDRCPVVSEDFAQWIVEDDFCNERPPLEEVGVQFVPDAKPYELHKKRLLNGSHSAIGYLGHLCGHERIDEAVGDPLVRRFVASLMGEVTPLLPEVLGLDVGEYRETLLERFGNPRVGDRLRRLCGRGSTKMPAYLLPSLEEAVERDLPHETLTLALAAWVRYLTGVDCEGQPIEVEDARWEELRPLARAAATDPRPLLEVCDVFGSLAENEAFVEELTRAIRLLDARGPVAAAEACLADRRAMAA